MADSARETLKLVVVGHVDHGKSTLVGRLLNDTDSLPPGKAEAIRTMSERRGMPFEWAFVLDALQAERDQGITIDTTQIWFRTPRRDTVIIDAPGHKEFLKNMVTGAAQADAAVLVIDAQEGVAEQSRRHGYLLHLLGLGQVAVAINKMDLVGADEARFRALEHEVRAYLKQLHIEPAAVVPVVARDGDGIVRRTARLAWYDGPTLVEAIDRFRPAVSAAGQPLRLPIQDVYKFDERRILVGRIESGRLSVGDRLLFSPVNRSARVASIEAWNASVAPREAEAGQSVGITLDEQLFVERGTLASHMERPPVETDVFRARLFWLGRQPLRLGQTLKLKLHTSEAPVTVQSIERVIDTGDLSSARAEQVDRNAVAEVVLRSRAMLALDAHDALPRTGRFVLIDGYDIAGGGIVSMQGYADQRGLLTARATNVRRVEHRVGIDERGRRNGHVGGVLWLTGLSGAGKSTLAVEVERRLFDKGYQVYVLDGDNLRFGLNADLGFSPEERAENIRRVGEVAALFSRAGFIVLSAFISPYRSDRERARAAAKDRFHEIYVRADLAVCERRDPKGLYRRARAGEIAEFTGISAPYEPPEQPQLVVDTGTETVEQCVDSMLSYIERNFAFGK
ncbi:MAG TPA: adenylyl-sulfate kinase [Candidatus Cybelea sp.]|nr:adenylyl-sulfate kinase [Candidatus Cybelea sp.]